MSHPIRARKGRPPPPPPPRTRTTSTFSHASMSARGTNSPLFSDRSGRSGSAGSAGLSPSYSVSQAGVAALRGSRSPHRHKISRKASRQGDDLTPPAAGLLSRVPMLKTVFLTVLIVELAAALFLLVRTHQDHAVEVNERNDARLLAAHAAFVRAIRDGMLQYAKQVEFFRGMVPLVSSAEEFAAIIDVPLLETVVTYTEIVQHDDRDQFEQATFDDWQGLPGAAQVSRNITEVQVGTNSIVNGTRVRPVQPMYLPVRFGAPPEDTSWFVLRDVLGDPWRKALNEAALQNPSAITLVPRSVSKFDGVTQTASAFLTGVVSPTNSSQVVGTLASVFFWQSFLGEYLAQQPHENVRIKLFDVTPNSPGQLGCDSPLLFSGVLQDDGQWSVVPAEDLLACSAVDTSLDGETRSSIFDISGRSLLLATKKVSGFDEEVDATDTWLNSAFAVVTIVMVLVVIVHAYLVVHHLRHAARATSAYMHELKEAEQEAREAAEHRDQFLAFLSHELRNPLFGLAGTVDEAAERAAYCQCHDVRDTVCEAFETLRECTQQIEGTLNTVVNVQNMTTGRIVLDESAFDVRALSREMRHFFQDQADCKRVVLLFHVDASVPEVVIGDRLRIAEVVSHLLRNAITHTRAGSTVSCTVTVRSPQPYMTRSISKASIVPVHVDQQYDHSLELSAVSRSIPSERSKRTSSSVASTNGPREEHELLWVVRDQGPGMSTEQMKRAFLPYTRERIANASNVGGANLGLPIVKLLCNQMGGTVRVRSGQGLGCEFTASMRLATASSEDVITPLPDDAALSVIMSEAGTGTASVPSHHVLHADELGLPPLPVHDSDLQKFEGRFLVVDDQRVNRRLVSRILSKVMPRASVDLAVDGVDAVAKVHAAEADGAPFSCVFMDIQMPLMSGIEATVKLRSEGYEVPVIAVTGGSLEEEIAKYQEAGMLAVIHKPCTRDGFSTTLKTYWWSHIAGPMGL